MMATALATTGGAIGPAGAMHDLHEADIQLPYTNPGAMSSETSKRTLHTYRDHRDIYKLTTGSYARL